MTTYDFSPLFRSTVGFDRFARLVDSALQSEPATTAYPPYNIETTNEDAYRITMAVAGFGEDELGIEAKENTLTITGRKDDEGQDARYLHRGIAARHFQRRFQLADHVKVAGANLSNGLLSVDLVREVPEEMKPRRITIKNEAPTSLVAKAKSLLDGSSRKAA